MITVRFGRGTPEWHAGEPHAHLHRFPVLAYFARGGAPRRAGSRRRLESGGVYVIAPGEIVAGEDAGGLDELRPDPVFLPEALGPQAPGSLRFWRTHPLLYPFARAAGGTTRLRVPMAERVAWEEALAALDRGLRDRREGYQTAVIAYLTLLLVALARPATDAANEFRLNSEPLLADVFPFLEDRYADGTSLQDVARAVHLARGI